jgi:hypothetical protein
MDELAGLDKILSDSMSAKASLRDAVVAKVKVESAIRIVKESTPKAKSNESDTAFALALQVAKDSAPEIYAASVKDAATKSGEYAYDAFLLPLLEVGDNEGLYKITPIGIGWNRSISVDLAMNELAGDLDEYADAVEAARASLGIKEERDGSKASKYWRDMVYPEREGRYALTIDLRLLAASSPAPFWSLLNDGSKNVSMSSDIDGGRAYPSRGGHRFVQQTENGIRKAFLSEFRNLKSQTKGEDGGAKESLVEANKVLIKLQEEIDKLAANSDLMLALSKEIGVTVKELNACRVLFYADRIKSGEALTEKLTLGKGIRMRKGRFSSIVSGFGE